MGLHCRLSSNTPRLLRLVFWHRTGIRDVFLRHVAPPRVLCFFFQVMRERTEAPGNHHKGRCTSQRKAEIEDQRRDDAVEVDRDGPTFLA